MNNWMEVRSQRVIDAERPVIFMSSDEVSRGDDVPATVTANRMPEYDDLYQTHRGHVLRLCRLLLADADEADDVSQEVFLKLFRQYQAGAEAMAWGPWLTRVTVNACHDRRRSGWWKWWRERYQPFDEADLPGRASSAEQEVLRLERRREVWQALRQLSVRQREVFVLRHLEGCSTAEVAEVLGLSPGSIKRHLYRAVHQMRQALRGSR